MTGIKLSSCWIKYVFALAFCLISFVSLSYPKPVQAQTIQPVILKTIPIALLRLEYVAAMTPQVLRAMPETWTSYMVANFNPPRRKKPSENWWSRILRLGRRGPCNYLDPPLIAFMPPAEVNSKTVSGEELENFVVWTANEQPTLWFYIPKQEQFQLEFAQLMLQDEDDEDVLKQPVLIPLKTSGIFRYKLEKPLELDKIYHWYFSLLCEPRRPSRNPSVDGWVQRVKQVSLGLDEHQLEAATPQERIELFASKDLWYETLTLLAEQRCIEPNNPILANYWAAMLRDINLEGIDQWSYCSSIQQLHSAHDSQP